MFFNLKNNNQNSFEKQSEFFSRNGLNEEEIINSLLLENSGNDEELKRINFKWLDEFECDINKMVAELNKFLK